MGKVAISALEIAAYTAKQPNKKKRGIWKKFKTESDNITVHVNTRNTMREKTNLNRVSFNSYPVFAVIQDSELINSFGDVWRWRLATQQDK